jgi:hypothetical protein
MLIRPTDCSQEGDLLGPIIGNTAQLIEALTRQESGEQQEAYPDVYRRIRDVEDPNEPRLRRVEEVDHRAKTNTVEGVSDGSCDDEGKPNRAYARH